MYNLPIVSQKIHVKGVFTLITILDVSKIRCHSILEKIVAMSISKHAKIYIFQRELIDL
jgi:hypothetical protein